MSATKLFNIRITPHKHLQFKRYASLHNISMGALLNGYIDRLLDGTEDTPAEDMERRARSSDPLESIRTQYTQGEDY